MIIDKKGRILGKVSIIDVLVLLLILAVLGGVGYKYKKSGTATPFTRLDDLEITLYQEEAPEPAAKGVKTGDPVREAIQGSYFGKVKDVKIDKSVSWVEDRNDGKYVASFKQGYASIYITIEGKGLFGDNGVTIDNAVYFVGKTLEVRVGNSVFWARIWDIRKKE